MQLIKAPNFTLWRVGKNTEGIILTEYSVGSPLWNGKIRQDEPPTTLLDTL